MIQPLVVIVESAKSISEKTGGTDVMVPVIVGDAVASPLLLQVGLCDAIAEGEPRVVFINHGERVVTRVLAIAGVAAEDTVTSPGDTIAVVELRVVFVNCGRVLLDPRTTGVMIK